MNIVWQPKKKRIHFLFSPFNWIHLVNGSSFMHFTSNCIIWFCESHLHMPVLCVCVLNMTLCLHSLKDSYVYRLLSGCFSGKITTMQKHNALGIKTKKKKPIAICQSFRYSDSLLPIPPHLIKSILIVDLKLFLKCIMYFFGWFQCVHCVALFSESHLNFTSGNWSKKL